MTQREQARKAIEQVHGNGGQSIYRALLQHRQQHRHLVRGLDDLVQYQDQRQEQSYDDQGNEVLLVIFLLQHSFHPLIPCPWSFRQTDR